jgi:multisubunit Na+/H+ antiporter MnhF subunit
MMNNAIAFIYEIGLVILVVLLLPCAYRVFVGPNAADRLQALDTITTLLIGIIVMLALVQQSSWLVDIGIALAAFGFIATLAIARYLSEGRVF